jgi:hypothetical protein
MNSETGFSSKLRRLTALFTCLRNDPRGTRHRARNIAPPSCESVARRCRPMASSPRILNRHRQGQTPKLCKKPPSQFIILRVLRPQGAAKHKQR